ncbi:WD40 repeat-like protein, partial [Calocera viscosa TUFC12733]
MCLIGVALEGHKDAVTSVAFSPDGKWFVSGSSDWTVRIWDAETGRAMGEPLEGHENAVTSVAFLPDGKRVLSGSSDGTVRVWDQGRAMNRLSLSPDPRHQAAQAYKAPDEAEVDIKFDLETGWIIGNEKDHLLWVPPEVMPRLYQNGRLKMIMPAERMVTLDLSQFVHGDRWTDCYTP